MENSLFSGGCQISPLSLRVYFSEKNVAKMRRPEEFEMCPDSMAFVGNLSGFEFRGPEVVCCCLGIGCSKFYKIEQN